MPICNPEASSDNWRKEMPDITLSAAHKEEVPQGTIKDYGADFDVVSLHDDLEAKKLNVTWKSVLMTGKQFHLRADNVDGATLRKIMNTEETLAAKTYDQIMTDIGGAHGVTPANISSWLDANYADKVG